MAKKTHGKEIANKFILRENYLKDEYFEDAIVKKKNAFKQCFPKCDIIVRRNKHGARVIVYEKLNK